MPIVVDKDLKKLLSRYSHLALTRTRRHLRISNLKTGNFVIAPCSGSDWRGIKNLESDLKRLCAGVGYYNRRAQ